MILDIFNSEDPYEVSQTTEQEPQKWEKIGQVLNIACSVIAVSAFVPAALKKKRIYTPIQHGNSYIPPAPIEGALEEIKEPRVLPVPHCLPEEKRNIEKLFGTLADAKTNLASPFVGYELYALGNKIEHIHPLTLLMNMPKETMQGIFNTKSEFRIEQVIGGIQKGMEKELARNKVFCFLDKFAEGMGKETESLKRLIQSADWKKFVQYLFDIPGERL
jgi:hypothetical protein